VKGSHDARFVALHAGDLDRLLLGTQILVDDADAALLRDGDGQARFGDRVHGGGHQGQVQADVAGKPGGKTGVAGQHLGERGHQQNVVEGERFSE